MADRRKAKWWVKSQQQWFNIGLLVVTLANEVAEFYRQSDRIMPPWFMESLALIALIGNIILRAMPHDNEKLSLSNPDKDES